MRSFASLMSFGLMATAARASTVDQEQDEGIPETGLDTSAWTTGQVPPLDDMLCINDYQIAAKNYMATEDYVYYRTGGTDETTYMKNLEIYRQVILNRFCFADVSDVNLNTTILGYEFAAPYFITSAAKAGKANSGAETNLMKAANTAGLLYVASIDSTQSIETIANAAADGQIYMHQEYIWADKDKLQTELDSFKANGYKAVFLTVDNFSVNGIRTRSQRFTGPGGYTSTHEQDFTYQALKDLQDMTDLPIVPKGVTSAVEIKALADMGFPAIYVSNHGGRMIDGVPTPVEILLDLHSQYPEVFDQVEIYADGGVRRATDVLILLALGVRAVGMGRSPLFANVFGQEGIEKMFSDFKLEMTTTMKNMGQSNIDGYRGNTTFVNTKAIEYGYFGAPLASGSTAKRDLFFHREPVVDGQEFAKRAMNLS